MNFKNIFKKDSNDDTFFYDAANLDFNFVNFDLWILTIDEIFLNESLKKQSLQLNILYSPFNHEKSDLVIALKKQENFTYLITNNGFLNQENLFFQFTIKSSLMDHSQKYVQLIHPIIFVLCNCIYNYLLSCYKYNNFTNKIKAFFPYNFLNNKISYDNEKELKKYNDELKKNISKFKFNFSINIKNFFSNITEKLLKESIVDLFDISDNNLVTLTTFFKFINLESNSIIPLFETSPLFFFISSFVVLKRILNLFFIEYQEKINFECEIVQYIDNITFFCNDENKINEIYFLLQNFLFTKFNFDINHLKNKTGNNDLLPVKSNSNKSFFEYFINLIDYFENNNKSNLIFDSQKFIINFEKDKKIKFIDYSSIENISEKEYLILLDKINKFSCNSIISLKYIQLISLNSKFFIKLLCELDSKYSKNKEDFLIKHLYDFLDYCNNNYERIEELEKIYFNDLIYYYFLNRSYRKLNDWTYDKFLKFYKNAEKFNMDFYIPYDNFLSQKIKKYNSNFGWINFSLNKNDYITAMLCLASILEDVCILFLKTKKVNYDERNKWYKFNDLIFKSLIFDYSDDGFIDYDESIKYLKDIKDFRNSLQFVHYSDNRSKQLKTINNILKTIKYGKYILSCIIRKIIDDISN